MFTLDVDIPNVGAPMFAYGRGVIADIEIWHKHIGHMNIQRLKSMQTQNIIVDLSKLKVNGMQKVCEAGQTCISMQS